MQAIEQGPIPAQPPDHEVEIRTPPPLKAASPHPKRSRMVMVSTVGVLFICAFVLWWSQTSISIPLYQTARVQRGQIEASISATGTCNAVVSVQVGSQVSGNIKALYADFNSEVKRGQLVALIDPELFQARVDQTLANWESAMASKANAEANVHRAMADLASARAAAMTQTAAVAKARAGVADARSRLARRREMFQSQILSREDLDTAQAVYDQSEAELDAANAQLEAAQRNIEAVAAAHQASVTQLSVAEAQGRQSLATLNQARIDLAHTRILAPVDGTVIARRVDVGQTVAASFQAPTIFEIAQDLTKMQVDTNIDEADVGRLRVGQSARFTVDAYPGTQFQGVVAQIRQAPLNVQNVITYDAVITVANTGSKLFPGMTANVKILTDKKDNVLKVPNPALRFRLPGSTEQAGRRVIGSDSRIVYVLGESGDIHPVTVKTGVSDGAFTAIEEGSLEERQQIVIGINAKKSPGTPAPAAMPRRTGF